MDMVDIQVMVPPGSSPETYEPKPAQMTAMGRARLYFSIGIPFEAVWLKKIASMNPDLRIVPTDAGIQKRTLESHACAEPVPAKETPGRHGPDAHSGHALDPHIWLSPLLVMSQAEMIVVALQQADPARKDAYERNYQSFIARLADLDARLKEMFTGIQTNRFMVLHPAWGYFAQAYGLTQIPIEVEGKAPKPAQMKELIDYARRHSLTVILVQPQSSAKWAEQVAQAIHGEIVSADPLSPDWERNLLDVAARIKNALR
jgi:zinc transport system substrate-binding protein